MATPDEIRDAVSEAIVAGDEEQQIGDRRIKKYDPVKALRAAELLAQMSTTSGPFYRVGLRSRPC